MCNAHYNALTDPLFEDNRNLKFSEIINQIVWSFIISTGN